MQILGINARKRWTAANTNLVSDSRQFVIFFFLIFPFPSISPFFFLRKYTHIFGHALIREEERSIDGKIIKIMKIKIYYSGSLSSRGGREITRRLVIYEVREWPGCRSFDKHAARIQNGGKGRREKVGVGDAIRSSNSTRQNCTP